MNEIAHIQPAPPVIANGEIGDYRELFKALLKPRHFLIKHRKLLDTAWPPDCGKSIHIQPRRRLTVDAERLRPGTAKNWLDKIPDDEVMTVGYLQVQAALDEKADHHQIRIIIGALVDRYPNSGSVIIGSYVDGIAIDVDDETDFSAAVVASATTSLIGKQKFLPVTSEILEECYRTERWFRLALRQIDHLIELRCSAEDVIEELREYNG